MQVSRLHGKCASIIAPRVASFTSAEPIGVEEMFTEALIRDNIEDSRHELLSGDEVVAYLTYRLDGNRVYLDYTEVDSSRRGEGMGASLVRGVLSEARDRGLSVVPACPFVAGYIKDHEEYSDLVPIDHRHEFDIGP